MSTIQIAGLSAAAVVALWPQIKFAAAWVAVAVASLVRRDAVVPERPGVVASNFRDSVAYLAQVRHRLLVTESLGDEQKKAIEVLTLALVAGSDK